jgi:hypothetical protein
LRVPVTGRLRVKDGLTKSTKSEHTDDAESLPQRYQFPSNSQVAGRASAAGPSSLPSCELILATFLHWMPTALLSFSQAV